MKITALILLGVFIIYELFIKDAFGFKKIMVKHLGGFDNRIYGALISTVIPLLLLLLFRETHVYTARNLDNLLIVLSIFVSILFGIMGDLSGKEIKSTEGAILKDITLSNAIFIATECLISMILTFGLMTSYAYDNEIDLLFKVVNSINFYLVFSIFINTLMILKRFSKLIRN